MQISVGHGSSGRPRDKEALKQVLVSVSDNVVHMD